MAPTPSSSAWLQARFEEFLLDVNHDVTRARWAASFATKHRDHPLLARLFRQVEKEWESRQETVRQSIRTETAALRPRRRVRGQLTVDEAIRLLERHEEYLLQAQAGAKEAMDKHLAEITQKQAQLAAALSTTASPVQVDVRAIKALTDTLKQSAP